MDRGDVVIMMIVGKDRILVKVALVLRLRILPSATRSDASLPNVENVGKIKPGPTDTG